MGSGFFLCQRYLDRRIMQPALERRKYDAHGQIITLVVTVRPLTIDTIPVRPKKVPPTRTRILARCHSFVRNAVQQPRDIARNIAPRNLTASSFTGQGQYMIIELG